MKFSFKAFLIIATLFCVSLDEFAIEEAQAGLLVRQVRSRYRRRTKKSTFASIKTQPKTGGAAFGMRKSVGKVYASRLKEYKIALKYWQKEKKLVEKIEKENQKLLVKKQKEDAKARVEMAKRVAKQREKQKIALAEAQAGQAAHEAETADSSGEKKSSKSKSFFSKLAGKTDTAQPGTPVTGKTGFKREKLKFMSRLFLSLFGKE